MAPLFWTNIGFVFATVFSTDFKSLISSQTNEVGCLTFFQKLIELLVIFIVISFLHLFLDKSRLFFSIFSTNLFHLLFLSIYFHVFHIFSLTGHEISLSFFWYLNRSSLSLIHRRECVVFSRLLHYLLVIALICRQLFLSLVVDNFALCAL